MAHFDDIILPLGMSLGSAFGPGTNTQQLLVGSGVRKTNQRWAFKLRTFDIGFNVKTSTDIYTILEIFESVEGPGGSFLARGWNDWNTTRGLMDSGDEQFVSSTDQPTHNTVTGSTGGDGTTVTFQLIKRYTPTGSVAASNRNITKLDSTSFKIQFEGSTLSTSAFTVASTTGIVTMTTAPTSTEGSPRWGGVFFTPVAFTSDDFLESLDFNNNSVSISLQEVKLSS